MGFDTISVGGLDEEIEILYYKCCREPHVVSYGETTITTRVNIMFLSEQIETPQEIVHHYVN